MKASDYKRYLEVLKETLTSCMDSGTFLGRDNYMPLVFLIPRTKGKTWRLVPYKYNNRYHLDLVTEGHSATVAIGLTPPDALLHYASSEYTCLPPELAEIEKEVKGCIISQCPVYSPPGL